MRTLAWTLVTLTSLGGAALADPNYGAEDAAGVESISVRGSSHRGIAQDYLVMPSGGELTGSMSFLVADPSLGGQPLQFSDVGLFSLAGRWSLFSRLEVSGGVTLLAKQPSFTEEKPWQSVTLGLRSPIGHKAAFALSGAGGHLLGHQGMWTQEGMSLEWRKPIAPVLDFGITGGVDGVALTAPHHKSAFLTEVAIATSALFREPSGHWGAWLGISYALPVASQGDDPTTGMKLDPQPRLDLRAGTVLAITEQWDLFAEFAVVDRGDLSNAATRLPILEGGFDQRQVIFGVTRHLQGSNNRPTHDGDAIQVGTADRRGD